MAIKLASSLLALNIPSNKILKTDANGNITEAVAGTDYLVTVPSHTHDASNITSGTFSTSRIPNLAASKITSGTFADARISSSSVTQHEADLTIHTLSGSTNDVITINSTLQVDQGSEDAIISFEQGGVEIGKFDQDGYLYATGFKSSGTTGFLKSDGSIDTSTYASSSHNHNSLYVAIAGGYYDSDFAWDGEHDFQNVIKVSGASATTTNTTALFYGTGGLVEKRALGTAAFSATSAFATAAQGALADSALQSLPAHNHDTRYYTKSQSDATYLTKGDSFIPISMTASDYEASAEEVILVSTGSYKGLAFPNGAKDFEFEVSIKGTNGANHQGIFWGATDLTSLYGTGLTGYKTTHQNADNLHIRDIANNSAQMTIDPGFAPDDGQYHRYRLVQYRNPDTSNAILKVYLDGNLIFDTSHGAYNNPPQEPTYFGFIVYTGDVKYAHWNVREITDSEDLIRTIGENVFQPVGNYLTSLPAHNHDARYYTETEMDTFLGGKLSTSGGTISGVLNVQNAIQVSDATFVDSSRGSIRLNSSNVGAGNGIFFRDGFNYNASITVEDHNGNYPDGICISGYDGVSFSTGSNDKNERMRVHTNGNVGIGTTNPTRKLHVDSDGNEVAFFKGNSGGAWIDIQSSTSNLWSIGAVDANKMGIYNRTNATYPLVVENGGNVGIGTTSPSEKLTVIGNAIIHSGSNLGTLSVGRSSAQNIKIYVDDTNNTITAYQDSDGNSEHIFALDRQFDGTGANNFFIRKAGSNQLKLDTSGNLRLYSYGAGILKTDANGNVSLDTSTYATQTYAAGEAQAVQDNLDSLAGSLGSLALEDSVTISEVTGLQTALDGKLSTSGGTLTGALTINQNGSALNLRSTTNSQPSRITFSSDVPASQIGYIEYTHVNTASYGSLEAFIIGGSEANKTILADGKLMYAEGIYSKPSSGTGAGTRKDANWDTAYSERNRWDGGSTGLNAATGRTSLGLGSAATAATTDFDPAGSAGAVESALTPQIAGAQTTADNAAAAATTAQSAANAAQSTADDADANATAAKTDAANALTLASAALPKAGGTMTGDLTIDNNTPRIDLKADQSGSNVGGRLELNENGNLWLNAQGGKDLWLNWIAPTAQASKADLQVGDGNAGSAIMTVQGSTRRVGIGTTSPSNTLDVNGGAEINGETYIRSASNVGLRIQTTAQGTGGADGLRVGLNDTHAFVWQFENKPLAFATNGSQRMTISAAGNVGIGTTSPSEKLSVAGNISATGDIKLHTLNQRLSFSDTAGEVSYISHHDSIGQLTIASDNIISLRETDSNVVRHTFTTNDGNYTATGVITASGGNSTNWNTAYSQRNRWDGGSAGLNAATGRTSLGLGSAATSENSDFAPASHTHSYLPLSGGTMTGNLVMQDEAINFKSGGSSTLPQFFGHRSTTDLNSRWWTSEGGWAYTTFEAASTNAPSGATNNANGLLTFNTHVGDYGHQLAFTNTGTIYNRSRNGGSFSSWRSIATGDELQQLETYVNATFLQSVPSTFSATAITLSGIKLEESSDRAGLLEINRDGSNTWSGIMTKFSGTAEWALMGHETQFGLYDDQNNDWGWFYVENGRFEANYDGGAKFQTTSAGVKVIGELEMTSSNFRNNSSIHFITTGGSAQIGKFRSVQFSTSYSGTVPDNGVLFGTDTPMYRSAANQLNLAGNFIPDADRTFTLGLDSSRWQVVFCEVLDSAGLHEKNLQNPEGEKQIGEYKTGTVLVWKGGKNVPCTEPADHMRMGIAVKGVSSPLVQGAEPVLCTGEVNEGDYLVTSSVEGHAAAISPQYMRQHNLFDCVLGKALEGGNGDSHIIKTWVNI